MQVEHYIYSVAEVASSKLTGGETSTFRIYPGTESLGLYLKTGSLKIIETSAPNNGYVWNAEKALKPRLHTDATVIRVEALEDSELICIARRLNTDREVQYNIMGSTLTLPASWGFIVVDGTVTFNDQGNEIQAGYLQYVKPRDYDLTLNGPAEVVFIR